MTSEERMAWWKAAVGTKSKTSGAHRLWGPSERGERMAGLHTGLAGMGLVQVTKGELRERARK